MKSVFKHLMVCALVSMATAAGAQTTYTAKGGNALIPTVLSTVDLPDGNTLVRTTSTGFIWTNDADVVGGNGAFECSGFTTVSSEGEQLDGSGSCECLDTDGDVWRIWWSGSTDGEFGFFGGSGKYAGINGGGTWKLTNPYPDGRFLEEWEGSWTIPDHSME